MHSACFPLMLHTLTLLRFLVTALHRHAPVSPGQTKRPARGAGQPRAERSDASGPNRACSSFHIVQMRLPIFICFAGVPLLVLGNKNDLPGALDSRALSEAMQLGDIKDREVAVYSISCKRQSNIDNTLQWLTRHAK